MNVRAISAPLAYSDYLVATIAHAEGVAARLHAVSEQRLASAAADALREAARRSVRLDASPLTEATADRVDARLAEGLPPTEAVPVPAESGAQPAGSWARTLKLEDLPTQDVAAVEYANLRAVLESGQEFAGEIFVQPLSTLVRLHRAITHGLTPPEVAGQPRRTEQSVHDGAQGQVLYHTPPPQAVPELLEELSSWLSRKAARMPTLVVAGMTHHALLSWQPFEGANGRVARAAARLVLSARGVDPGGLLVFERALEADTLGYHKEIAATQRRADLVPWLERWCEAVHEAALDAARALDAVPRNEPSAEVGVLVEELPPVAEVTLRQVMERAGVEREQALRDLSHLQWTGVMRPVPGTKGLRWTKSSSQPADRTHPVR